MFLEKIDSPEDLRKLTIEELDQVAKELRDFMVDVVSKNGGHLASSLGVVEVTLALHYVFNTPVDRLIWDVGHQAYAHKILTGRRDSFPTVRTFGGISGFPKREESPYDTYNVGHSSTSLSLAMGEAVARDLRGDSNQVIAVIGDGSLTSGMAFEALNQIGQSKHDLIVILNDNEHSISKNVGAIAEYLTRVITGHFYNEMKTFSQRFVRRIPRIGESLYEFMVRASHGVKGFLTPGQLFEELGLRYFGPVDGHNTALLIDVLRSMKEVEPGPKLVHVITKKGKGYTPAENDPTRFHGVGPFDPVTGASPVKSGESYSAIAGKTLAYLAGRDRKIVAISAAMKIGTGLSELEKVDPGRVYDVGIAEQHAIAFASSLAVAGKKPFVSLYSTFLQRAVDQVIHDVAIMKLPVRILVDRAGIVGDDGETHHGVFDIAIFKNIPGMVFLAPSNGEELRDVLHYAVRYNDGPLMIRYPRGTGSKSEVDSAVEGPFEAGRCRVLSSGSDVTVIAVGDMVATAEEVKKILGEKSISAGVINLLSIAPLDVEGIAGAVRSSRYVVTLENGISQGGIGQEIAATLPYDLRCRFLFCGGFPREFVTHGTNAELMKLHGLDADSLAKRITEEIGRR